MGNGDLDGDEFALVWNDDFVAAFPADSARPWSEEEQHALVPIKSPAPQKTPTREAVRERAAAWHMVRTRCGSSAKGILSNQWLMVAETKGAADKLAIKLSYMCAMALDVAKMGGSAANVPPEARLPSFAEHLKHHFKNRSDRFTERSDTVLAQLVAFDGSQTLAPFVPPQEAYTHLVHTDYLPYNSPGWKETMVPFLSKWEALYKEFRDASKPPELFEDEREENDREERLRAMRDRYEVYRGKLLESYTLDEIKWPPPNSKLLAEAAAIYLEVHKHAFAQMANNPTWGKASFAWQVAGDYFVMIQSRKMHDEPTRRPGAVPMCDPHATPRWFAGRPARPALPAAPSSQSQTLDSQDP